MTYEENVRKVAEEMAAEYNNNKYSASYWDERSTSFKREAIKEYMIPAHIAVAFAKEEVKEFCKEWGDEYAREEVSKYLIERGLIPPPECEHINLESIGGRGWKCLDCDKVLTRDENGFTAPEDPSGPYAMGPGH